MRRAPLAVVSFLACILVPRSVLAQGESAIPLPAHTLRFTIGADWSHWSDRFGIATPLNPAFVSGAREPIGTYFGAESLGTTQLPFLAPAESQVRTLSGISGWLLNLGRAKMTLDASWRSTPLRLEYAPSTRFGFSVNVPIVRARMSAFLSGPDSTAATKGNVGFNSPSALVNFRSQADGALRALATQRISGPNAALRAQADTLYTRLRPFLCGLYDLAGGSPSDATSPCFSATATPAAVLMPIVGSDAGDTLRAFLRRDSVSYDSLRNQYQLAGSAALPAFTEGYTLPGAALDSAGVRQLFYDPNGPLAGDSLNEVVRTRLGDVELGAWVQLANGAHWRSQVAVTARLATGSPDSPDNFIDLPTGTHERGVEVAMKNDIVAGRNFWLHVGGRYGVSSPDQLLRRVSPWYLPYAPLSATALVQRKMGDYYGVDLVPNWQLDDAFDVGVGWHYYHQAATSFDYVGDPAQEQALIGYPASVLGLNTEVERMRVGVGVTFSTLDRYARGRARLPYRITWSYNTTMYGRGGQVPKDGVMSLMISAYFGSLR
ncbi:MAG: hypothetical protein ACHQU1_01775 [Gemmatimonadales bacterium]